MSNSFKINIATFDTLQEVMANYEGNVEEAINDVLHNQASELIQTSIQQLIPVSGKTWKGKAPAAKTSKSLTSRNSNLAVEVVTTKKYQYLYFPNDGTNTRRHVGNQQFFERGGDAVKDEIIDRCIAKLTNNFE